VKRFSFSVEDEASVKLSYDEFEMSSANLFIKVILLSFHLLAQCKESRADTLFTSLYVCWTMLDAAKSWRGHVSQQHLVQPPPILPQTNTSDAFFLVSIAYGDVKK
jgi:hypothetical protein